MSKKILAVFLGLLVVGLMSGTALAGDEGPINLSIMSVGKSIRLR